MEIQNYNTESYVREESESESFDKLLLFFFFFFFFFFSSEQNSRATFACNERMKSSVRRDETEELKSI